MWVFILFFTVDVNVCSTSYFFMFHVPCVGLMLHKYDTALPLFSCKLQSHQLSSRTNLYLCFMLSNGQSQAFHLFHFQSQWSDMNIVVSHCTAMQLIYSCSVCTKKWINNDIFSFFWKRFISFSKLCKIGCCKAAKFVQLLMCLFLFLPRNVQVGPLGHNWASSVPTASNK